jgi:heme exporter protein B
VKQIYWLIRRDILLELRQPQVISGIILHALGSVWIAYLAFKGIIPTNTWNSLLWIILLFSAVHSSNRAFGSDSGGRKLYYYTLADARHIILAKIIYNILLILTLSAITSMVFLLFNGNPILHPLRFILALLLASIGLAGILTFTSAIASQEARNFSLMAILSLPLTAPLLLLVIRLSTSAIQPTVASNLSAMVLALLLLDILCITLAWILFPYLWME